MCSWHEHIIFCVKVKKIDEKRHKNIGKLTVTHFSPLLTRQAQKIIGNQHRANSWASDLHHVLGAKSVADAAKTESQIALVLFAFRKARRIDFATTRRTHASEIRRPASLYIHI